MKTEEIEKVKRALSIIKLARRANHITFRAVVYGKPFKEVEDILQELSGWDEKDEKIIEEMQTKINEKMKDKTFHEKFSLLKKITAGGIIGLAVAGGVGFGLYRKSKNKNKRR